MKKILLCTFMLCCCISSMFADRWTDENGVEWEFWTNGNEATITLARNFGTEVSVPEKIIGVAAYPDENGNPFTQEFTVTSIGDGSGVFSEGKENLTKVILPSTIKTIGNWAFNECSALKSVDLSACTKIGDYAFNSCSSLTSAGDLSNCISIGGSAFYSCSKLTSIDLSACTKIGDYAFHGCSTLTSVGDLSACTSIGNAAFQNCSALTSVDLSNCESLGNQAFDVCKNLTSIGSLSKCKKMGEYAFAVCEKLEEVGDLSNCTSMGIGVFALCYSLKSVDVSHLTSIKNRMFDECHSLTSVGNLKNCTSIGEEAFSECYSLTSVGDLSACKTIENYAFDKCISLTTIGDLSVCTAIGECAFMSCGNITSIGNLPNLKTIGRAAFSCSDFWNKQIESNQTVMPSLETIGDIPLCEYIGGGAFSGNSALTTIGDLSSCTTIDGGAFSYCSSLSTIGDLSACISIGSDAFSGCSSLTTIEDLSACISIGDNAFMSCTSLINMDLQNCTTIGTGAFYGCTSLANIGNLLNCVNIEKCAFYNCVSLSCVGNLPKCQIIGENAFANSNYLEGDQTTSSLKTIGDLSACISIEKGAFMGCSSLQSIGGLPECKSLGDDVFSGCTSLQSIGELPKCISIGDGTFNGCSSLKEIDLRMCTTISNNAFSYCEALTKVGDLSKCISIGDNAFQNCVSLNEIGDLTACESIGSSAFAACSSLKSIGNLSACKHIGNLAFAYKPMWLGGTYPPMSLSTIGDLSSCESIGDNAFLGCNDLKYIVLPSTPPTLGKHNPLGDFLMLRVPEQNIPVYQSTDVWKEPAIANRIITISDNIDYNVTNTAQSSTPGLSKVIEDEDMLKVVTLKVSGTINSLDIIVMNNWMPNLRWLDLTDATIEECDHEYYSGFKTQDNVVGQRMFYEQDEYVSIKLPKNIQMIDKDAFLGCENLNSVTLYEGIRQIGDNAFCNCNSIKKIQIPKGCKTIAGHAFAHCGYLEEVIIGEGCEYIENSAFFMCNLKNIAFPSSLQYIGSSAFSYNSNLTKISLPNQLRYIGWGAFSCCQNLVELKIPSSVMTIDNEAFNDCDKLNKVYTYTLEPTSIIQETFSTYPTATLYVPTTSRDIYRINTEWSQFLKIEEFDEEYEYFYINKDYVLDDQTGVVGGKPDGDLNPGSGFIQEGTEDQEMGDIHIKDDGNSSGSIIGDGNINAENLFFDMTIEGGRWYFFCFPFKVYLSDITCPGLHVWRKYDGAKRAEKGEGGWVDLDADEDHLKKGYGYIFQASQSGTLTLKVTKEQFGKFENADHHHAVEEHPAQDENNASWNFMGNPHTSYYGIGEMGYDAPITIWTGTTYEAVRPGDDDYYLKPFQAFFVQKPEGTAEIAFDGDSRMTYLQSEQAQKEAKVRRMARGINPDRLLVNLTLSDGTHTDKTRVVFNDKQSIGYEMACDAAKFMSTEGTPQLYTLDNKHIRYAINERPNGDVTMGYSVSKEGTYTISVARMDKPMVLRDLEMGITFDLSNGDYTFTSKAGTNEKRFVLSANKGETGIADIMKETGVNIMAVEGGIHISGLNGQTVYIYDLSGAAIATQTTDGTAAVKAGTYVIKVDNLSTKLLVK